MVKRLLNGFTNLYGVWVIGIMVPAYFRPGLLDWFGGPWVRWALMLVMLAMGLTLHPADFMRVVRMPIPIAAGFIAQYTIMPLCAWGIARLLNLPPVFAAGLILVGCCPGGTASNLVTFLARANVALSVLLTMVSTVLATVMTPILVERLAGQYVPVDAWAMLKSTAQIVLLPVLLGVFINHRFHNMAVKLNEIGPALAVLAITLISGSMMARNVSVIRESVVALALASFLLHSFGFAFGYWTVRLLRFPRQDARTISIEVGMQNSGLAMVLAQQHFSPATAAPAVFSGIFHTLGGSLLAMIWRFSPVQCNELVCADAVVKRKGGVQDDA